MKNETGNTYGRLTVVRRGPNNRYGWAQWWCQCSCGNTTLLDGQKLRSGNTRSCGCLRRDVSAARMTLHGQVRHRLYSTWNNEKQRCMNPNNPDYKHYGGRGIKFYAGWHQFDVWLAYITQLPHAQESGMTIDRINNDGNYEPGNVRWVAWEDQAANRRQPKQEKS